MMKTIAFYIRKGGTGKTTLAVNVAACLSRVYNKKVLFIDCDTQCNATMYLLEDEKPPKTSLYQYFRKPDKVLGGLKINGLIKQIKYTFGENRQSSIATNMYLIPGSPELDYMDIDDPHLLMRLTEHVGDSYDYCIIDCPPAENALCLNGLCAADGLVVPVEPGKDSIYGYQKVSENVDGLRDNGYNDNLYIVGVVLNRLDGRVGSDKAYREAWLDSGLGDSVFKTYIHSASVFKDSREFGRPVHYFARSSRSAREIQGLTEEIMERMERFS